MFSWDCPTYPRFCMLIEKVVVLAESAASTASTPETPHVTTVDEQLG